LAAPGTTLPGAALGSSREVARLAAPPTAFRSFRAIADGEEQVGESARFAQAKTSVREKAASDFPVEMRTRVYTQQFSSDHLSAQPIFLAECFTSDCSLTSAFLWFSSAFLYLWRMLFA
jgi:hypothetical protein